MKFDSNKLHRRSIRLKGYDYSSPGAYFITICAYNRMLLFESEEVKRLIEEEWFNLYERFDNIQLDERIIMPNHFHGIIIIKKPNHDAKINLPSIIQAFKSLTTNCHLQSDISKRIDMPAKLWQKNYYEHIIRDEMELNAIREYIKNNPSNWQSDPENPINLLKQG